MASNPRIAGALCCAALALTLPAAPAAACGGFFCSARPIEQSGEQVVYALQADGSVVMSVRIDYVGDDDDFAWIVPVPVVPELSAGTDALFDALAATTTPRFTASRETRGTCRGYPSCVSSDGCGAVVDGCGGGAPTPTGPAPLPPRRVFDASAPSADAGVSRDASTVQVFSEETVGAYETVVLTASSGAEVGAWLREHNYQVPEGSEPLLQTYAAQGQIFVALRLRPDGNLLRRTHPLTLRMNTSEACLPIRLTAVATVPDMPITTYFLSEHRVTSANYSSADVDFAEPGLYGFTGGDFYRGLVDRAVDRLDGRAFVTEFAGATPEALAEAIPQYAPVDDLAEETDFGIYVIELLERGYSLEGELMPLLLEHLTPPADRAPLRWYRCLTSREYCGAPSYFDPEGLAAAIESELRGPAAEARALIEQHRYTTRLFTTMSAEEMTVDPIFVEDPDGLAVSNVHSATYVSLCDDEHFIEGAPTQWEIGSRVVADRRGNEADDHAYCSALGGVPNYDAPSCSEPSSGGGICTAAGVLPMQGGVIGGFALILLFRRRRRLRG